MSKKNKGKGNWNKNKKYNVSPSITSAIKHAKKPSRPTDDLKPIKFNISRIRDICNAPIKTFHDKGEVVWTPNGLRYIYIDNGADILAIAHMDFVTGLRHFYCEKAHGEPYIWSSRLDDRLGAYIILELLPKLGVKYDILLTDGEESGRSTGQYFQTEKEYKWMFQFDRNGTDVVLYQFDYHGDLTHDLEEVGCHIGWGSWSDISEMNHLGCAGMNFGTGYISEHSSWCHAPLYDTAYMVTQFLRFYRARKNEHYEWTEQDAHYADHWSWQSESSWGHQFQSTPTDDLSSHVPFCKACYRDFNKCYDHPCTTRMLMRGQAEYITPETPVGQEIDWQDGLVGYEKREYKPIHSQTTAEWEDDCPFCSIPISECEAAPCDTRYALLQQSILEYEPPKNWIPCAYCNVWIDLEEDSVYILISTDDLLCDACADIMEDEGWETQEAHDVTRFLD